MSVRRRPVWRVRLLALAAGLAVSVLTLTAALAQSPSSPAVYRWVDAQGRIHFGDPASAPAGAEVLAPLTPPASAPTAAAVADEGSYALADAAEDCTRERDRLAMLASAERIIETDSLGEQRELTAEAREQLVARTELAVQRLCAGDTERP